MDDTTTLILSVVLGAIGAGYFVYGKKQQRFVALAAGLLLCTYPFFVSNLYAVIVLGVVLVAAPFVFRV